MGNLSINGNTRDLHVWLSGYFNNRGQSMVCISTFFPPHKSPFWHILPMAHNTGNLLIKLLHGIACGSILPHSHKQSLRDISAITGSYTLINMYLFQFEKKRTKNWFPYKVEINFGCNFPV